MANIDGLPVNSAVTHAEFVSRTEDSSTIGKLALQNTDPVSGSSVTNVQKAVNKAFEGIGATGESDTTINNYSSNNYITNGDNRKVAIGKLDLQLKTTQDELDTHEAASDPHPQYATDVALAAGLALKYDASNPSNYQTAAQVTSAINAVIDAAPGTLDTLNELAAALGDDPNFATAVTTSLAGKEPTITGGTTSQYWRGDKTFQTLDNSAVGLSSVTNDAQLKRAANDFNTFTEKTTLANDDLFIIEDSAASGAKKYVKSSNVGAGGAGVAAVYVKAYNTSGLSITNTATTDITSWTVVNDTHSAFNATTGVFTCPIAGQYRISGNLTTSSTAFPSGSNKYWQANVLGPSSTVWELDTRAVQAAFTGYLSSSGSTTINLAISDTLVLRGTNQTGTGISLIANQPSNWISIERIK